MSIHDILSDLAFVAQYWPDLHDARIPGTKRPWRQTDLTPTKRAELAARDRAERFDRSILGLAAAPAPVHVDILDALVDAQAIAYELGKLVTDRADVRPPTVPASVYADPRNNLATIGKHLIAAIENDPLVESKAQRNSQYLKQQVAVALRLITDGQVVGDCPWCGGVRAMKLRYVRQINPETGAYENDPRIVCQSSYVCDPPSMACDPQLQVRGRPAWRYTDWEWLSAQMVADDVRRAVS